MSRVHYRAQVYEVDDTTVDFTLEADDFTAFPTRFGGQRVNLLEGRVESIAFSFDVRAAGFQDQIVVSGAPQILQRRIQFQKSPDNAVWSDVGGGRVQQVEQGQNLSYRITVMDERFVERNTVIFAEADTTSIFPPHERNVLNRLRRGAPSSSDRFIRIVRVTAATTDGVASIDFPHPAGGSQALHSRIQDLIDDDIRPGNERVTLAEGETRYTYLTLHIVGNSTADTWEGDYRVRDIEFDELAPAIADQRMKVLDPAGTLSPSTVVRNGYLYLPKAPPSDDVPLHVPETATFLRDIRFSGFPQEQSQGIHPFQLVKDIYDGSYQQTVLTGTTETVSPRTVRYSTATLSTYDPSSNKGGLIDNPKYPLVRFRITESETMADFLHRGIFAPLNVLPVIDAAGRVKPTEFNLPTAETIPSTTGIFQFTPSNIAAPPSWVHGARDQLTAIRFRYPRFVESTVRDERTEILMPTDDAGMDKLIERAREVDRRHARLDAGELTRREVIREIPGTDTDTGGENTADINAAELFARYGDGPQVSQVPATTAASTVLPGDLAIVNVAGFPNTANSTRGDAVMMQVVAKSPTPTGFTFNLLHVGEHLQPLPTPTIDVQRSATNPRHGLRLSVTGFASTNDTALYQLADTTGTPAPTDYRNVAAEKAGRSLDVGDLKSGTKWHGRARLIREGRVGGLWSVADSTTTQAMAPPTALASTFQGGTYIELSWQNGEDGERVELLNPTTRRDLLPAGSRRYQDRGLLPGTTHGYRVRHRDPFGGVSAATTQLSVSTSTDADDNLQLDPPFTFEITQGEDSLVSSVSSSTST